MGGLVRIRRSRAEGGRSYGRADLATSERGGGGTRESVRLDTGRGSVRGCLCVSSVPYLLTLVPERRTDRSEDPRDAIGKVVAVAEPIMGVVCWIRR